jgi:hypothetical protein
MVSGTVNKTLANYEQCMNERGFVYNLLTVPDTFYEI